MNRRQFIASSGAAGLVATQGTSSMVASAEAPAPPGLMKLGDQTAPTNDVHLKYLARYGVRNICGYPQIEGDRLYATANELKKMMDMAGKYGINIDWTAPPFLESSYIDREKHPAIMLAQSSERDRNIEALQTFIRNCSLAGIPSIKYNMNPGVLRTGRTPGRGDAMNHVFPDEGDIDFVKAIKVYKVIGYRYMKFTWLVKRMTKIIGSFSETLSQRGSLMDRATRGLIAVDADRSGAEWIL